MSIQDWVADTRAAYDTVAVSYTDQLRDALTTSPYERGILAIFAELANGRGGPVADIGCGPGRITGHLHDLGLDVFGIDLSPAMIDVARSDHPDLRFEVGSMTDLDLADSSVAGLVAYFAIIHIPDDEIPTVLAQFHRVLRPDGVLLLAFQVGDDRQLKTKGHGGESIKLHYHRRPPELVAVWLREAGFTVEAQMLHSPSENAQGAFLFARRES